MNLIPLYEYNLTEVNSKVSRHLKSEINFKTLERGISSGTFNNSFGIIPDDFSKVKICILDIEANDNE